MVINSTSALHKRYEALRHQVKRLRAKVKQQKKELGELQGKRDVLRWMVDNPVTPEEIKETERWWKETWAAFQRGELLDGEEVLSEIERTLKKKKQSWKKKRTSRSSSRKR